MDICLSVTLYNSSSWRAESSGRPADKPGKLAARWPAAASLALLSSPSLLGLCSASALLCLCCCCMPPRLVHRHSPSRAASLLPRVERLLHRWSFHWRCCQPPSAPDRDVKDGVALLRRTTLLRDQSDPRRPSPRPPELLIPASSSPSRITEITSRP